MPDSDDPTSTPPYPAPLPGNGIADDLMGMMRMGHADPVAVALLAVAYEIRRASAVMLAGPDPDATRTVIAAVMGPLGAVEQQIADAQRAANQPGTGA
ncbi:MAG TPA: hypothetical protein VGL46_13335 [Pseudonocardiaceae bacterium]|jgi:hypothetical protein